MALQDKPKEVVENLKRLEKYGMYNKYGFYESLDFSPQRLKANEEANVVKNIYGTPSSFNTIINK